MNYRTVVIVKKIKKILELFTQR